MLKKWKAEKLLRLEEAKKKAKPVFKVGVIQRTATGSPLVGNSNWNVKKKLVTDSAISKCGKENVDGIMTRSKSRAIAQQTGKSDQKSKLNPKNKNALPLPNKFCKIDKGKIKPLDSYKFKLPKSVSELPASKSLTYPNSPKITKSKKLMKGSKGKSENNDNDEMNLKETSFTLSNSENANHVNSDKTENESIQPVCYSPFTKKNTRISLKQTETKEDNDFQNKILSFRYFVDLVSVLYCTM